MPTHRTPNDRSGDSTSATGRAYRALKSEILRCDLAPGTAVYEGQTAIRLGMSKTPVREALGMLVHEGLVEVRPRQGYRVTAITLADVQEVFEMRLLLEPVAAEFAADRATPQQLDTLANLVTSESDTYRDQVLQTNVFHEVLADASGNTRLAASLMGLIGQMQRLYFLGFDTAESVQFCCAQQRKLLDALMGRDHQLAREIATRQVETERKKLMDAIASALSAGNTSDQSVLNPQRSRSDTY